MKKKTKKERIDEKYKEFFRLLCEEKDWSIDENGDVVYKNEFPPKDRKENPRKDIPLYTGLLCYFPDALAEVAKTSLAGNRQHHADKPLHWDKTKSTDNADALMRHLRDYASGIKIDDDGVPHLNKVAWRALALLQIEIDKENNK